MQVDLLTALDRLAPESVPWTHDLEGPDDMPSHVKAMLTATSLQVPVVDQRLVLGTWQAIYLIEHRSSPHQPQDRCCSLSERDWSVFERSGYRFASRKRVEREPRAPFRSYRNGALGDSGDGVVHETAADNAAAASCEDGSVELSPW